MSGGWSRNADHEDSQFTLTLGPWTAVPKTPAAQWLPIHQPRRSLTVVANLFQETFAPFFNSALKRRLLGVVDHVHPIAATVGKDPPRNDIGCRRMVLDDPDEKRPLARQGNCGGQHLSLFGNRRVAEFPGLQPEQLRSGGLAEIVPRATRIVVRPQRSKMSRTRARPVNTFLPGLCSMRFTGMVITWLGHARIAPSTSAAAVTSSKSDRKEYWNLALRAITKHSQPTPPSSPSSKRTATIPRGDSIILLLRFSRDPLPLSFLLLLPPFLGLLGRAPEGSLFFLGDVKSQSQRSRELRISRGVR